MTGLQLPMRLPCGRRRESDGGPTAHAAGPRSPREHRGARGGHRWGENKPAEAMAVPIKGLSKSSVIRNGSRGRHADGNQRLNPERKNKTASQKKPSNIALACLPSATSVHPGPVCASQENQARAGNRA